MNDTLPAFVFPAEAGTHLLTQEGWKAEFALVAGWLHTEISVQHRELNKDKITHLSIRWRWRRTSWIGEQLMHPPSVLSMDV